MKQFSIMKQSEKRVLLDIASAKSGLPVHIIEKDYWVCWLLRLLFTSDALKDHLTFKGGTSLSKVYNIIKRFSEDVDLSIEKSFFGFSGDKDPSNAKSRKQSKALINDLVFATKKFVEGDLTSQLENLIEHELSQGKQALIKEKDWSLQIDPQDKDGQTILFFYPTEVNKLSSYVNPSIKLEIGARADHWPVEMKTISPYVAMAKEDIFKDEICKVRVLSIERTFWEKITILHMYANYPNEKTVPIRQSRHYYDVYCLLKSDAKNIALKNIDLLQKVSEHKQTYFRSGWADYESSRDPKLIKLMPSQRVLSVMEKDYLHMQEMFFEKAPKWSDVISTIKEFEVTLKSLN